MRYSRSFKSVFAAILIVGCSRGELPSRDMLNYFESEVNHRLRILRQSTSVPDSVYSQVQAVHQRFGEMILLSKDIENLPASVHLSNNFLNEIFIANGFSSEDISQLSADMHVNEIAVVLRQNELDYLNKLIMKTDSTTRIFTAQ